MRNESLHLKFAQPQRHVFHRSSRIGEDEAFLTAMQRRYYFGCIQVAAYELELHLRRGRRAAVRSDDRGGYLRDPIAALQPRQEFRGVAYRCGQSNPLEG